MRVAEARPLVGRNTRRGHLRRPRGAAGRWRPRSWAQTLASLEKTGRHDPVLTLRHASRRHELESAKSVARVLNHRLRLMTSSDARRATERQRQLQRTESTTDMPSFEV